MCPRESQHSARSSGQARLEVIAVKDALNGGLNEEYRDPRHADCRPFHFDYIESTVPNARAFRYRGYSFIGITIPLVYALWNSCHPPPNPATGACAARTGSFSDRRLPQPGNGESAWSRLFRRLERTLRVVTARPCSSAVAPIRPSVVASGVPRCCMRADRTAQRSATACVMGSSRVSKDGRKSFSSHSPRAARRLPGSRCSMPCLISASARTLVKRKRTSACVS